jgi:hypothetical protein
MDRAELLVNWIWARLERRFDARLCRNCRTEARLALGEERPDAEADVRDDNEDLRRETFAEAHELYDADRL